MNPRASLPGRTEGLAGTVTAPPAAGHPHATAEAQPAVVVGLRLPFDPGWCLHLPSPGDDELIRVAESLLCVADGVVGTRGALEEDRSFPVAPVAAEGLYEPAEGVGERLLALPPWFRIPFSTRFPPGERVLDLRDGVLIRTAVSGEVEVRTLRFASASRPGTTVLVAEVDVRALSEDVLATLSSRSVNVYRSSGGGGAVVAITTTLRARPDTKRGLTIERLATHVVAPRGVPRRGPAVRRLAGETGAGAARLLGEHRALWERRWLEADVEAVGDPEATLAVRFALFHLLSSARRRGEAAVGARGLTGPAYAGHVFWDTEVFVLPVLAAVDRRAARAVLEYRLRRLEVARQRAARQGRRGARFPWESASSGEDVTPQTGIDQHGESVSIRTGELEEHVTADVAWAAWHFAAWGGTWSFLTGPGRPLVLETARYWASRARWDASGSAHLDSVIGPDEYHVDVDDDAFTNLMARWNLRRAAELVERRHLTDEEVEEAEEWRKVAEALADNLDMTTGRYEQFAGYDRLDPLLVGDLGTPPLAADLLLGQDRVARTQMVKQADVLMAHHLIPDEVASGSLGVNLDHYLPRTAHGSSLSPAVHAALLARAGRPQEALALLRVAASIDLDDLTETTASGLHLGNLGGIWQAVVGGFAGLSVVRPDDRALSLAPHLPEGWEELRVRLWWHGRPLLLVCRADAVQVTCDRPMRVSLHGSEARIEPPGRWVT